MTRTVTIDLETGRFTGPITGEEGAMIAASVLPGLTPEFIDAMYSDFLEGETELPVTETDLLSVLTAEERRLIPYPATLTHLLHRRFIIRPRPTK